MNVLGPKESISKSTFVDSLSQVWYKDLSETNIISGFKANGIFPTNRDKCNIKLFDQPLYNHYQNWIELGRPTELNAENETNNEIDNEKLKKKT